MDLDKRFDQMDEELKLLKNQIKQVLLDIQEHVLAIQSPFAASIAQNPPQQHILSVQPPGDSAGSTSSQDTQEPAAQPPAPAPPAPAPAAPPPPPQPQTAPVIAGGFTPPAPQPSWAAQPQMPPQHFAPAYDREPPRLDRQHDEDGGSPDEAHVALDAPDGGEGKADKSTLHTSSSPQKKERTLRAPSPDRRKPEARQDTVHREVEASPSEVPESAEMSSDQPVDGYHDGSIEEPPEESQVVATSKGTRLREVDLVTVAGLAQWTSRIVSEMGAEQVESLLEVSDLRGRISTDLKHLVLTLARMFDKDDSQVRITVRQLISLLAQLDGLSGAGRPEDIRVLPFLLDGDSEVFPLARP